MSYLSALILLIAIVHSVDWGTYEYIPSKVIESANMRSHYEPDKQYIICSLRFRTMTMTSLPAGPTLIENAKLDMAGEGVSENPSDGPEEDSFYEHYNEPKFEFETAKSWGQPLNVSFPSPYTHPSWRKHGSEKTPVFYAINCKISDKPTVSFTLKRKGKCNGLGFSAEFQDAYAAKIDGWSALTRDLVERTYHMIYPIRSNYMPELKVKDCKFMLKSVTVLRTLLVLALSWW